MRIDELKRKVESSREGLKEKDRAQVIFSESGPVSMGLIDAIVATLEEQEKRIAVLEKTSNRYS